MWLEAEFVCSIRSICGGWGVLAQWYRSMFAGVSESTGILLLAKKASRSLSAFHLSFGLGALIEWAGSHWHQTWPLSFIPSSFNEARIYRYSSRRVAKLQCRIYFKRRDYLSYMSERKCPSVNMKGGFIVTNIKGQSLRMKIQYTSGPVRQRLLVHTPRSTSGYHGTLEQGI